MSPMVFGRRAPHSTRHRARRASARWRLSGVLLLTGVLGFSPLWSSAVAAPVETSTIGTSALQRSAIDNSYGDIGASSRGDAASRVAGAHHGARELTISRPSRVRDAGARVFRILGRAATSKQGRGPVSSGGLLGVGAEDQASSSLRAVSEDGTLSNGCDVSPRGIPQCGAYVGADIGPNDDVDSFENKVGRRLGVHRTYWQGGQVTSAVARAKTDLAAGRLPWLSFKLPHSWADMAAGAGDEWARHIARRLSKLPGPVWVAFHHEPEKDGPIAQWTRIQERLSPIVRATAPNVAFTIILTGYNQIHGEQQYHLDSLWPRNTKVDVVGFDLYDWYGTDTGANLKGPQDLSASFGPLSAWAKAHNIPWGLAETGRTPQSFKADPRWFRHVYSAMRADGGIAFSYFDSSSDREHDWVLKSQKEFSAFGEILRGSAALAPAT